MSNDHPHPGAGPLGAQSARAADARLRLVIHGHVQGLGFRPFVHGLAVRLGLAGWVRNTPRGVEIEAEGPVKVLDEFQLRLDLDKPPHAFIQSIEPFHLDPAGDTGFAIRESLRDGKPTALVLPDIATCPACLAEMAGAGNRRYRYPFTNCTHCGPRYSIIEALPYDREKTTMRHFRMCAECRAEYENPADRRFHAEPIACPRCGPQLAWWDPQGRVLASRDDALAAAGAALKSGAIVALKGIGGFQLLVDARSEDAVKRLRQRKKRDEKPFALLYPSCDMIARDCDADARSLRALQSPAAPIVLLNRLRGAKIAPGVAPGNPRLGVMLPCSPLHHLLMMDLQFPVVATSGNLSDEPICIDEHEAVHRLSGIADYFLVHNRPIVRHMDDSVLRILCGRETLLRRARGYAPLPLSIPAKGQPMLAVGAHMKNAVALAEDGLVFLSQHIGDLDTPPARKAFERVVEDLQRLRSVKAGIWVADLHPDYASTQFARGKGAQLIQVQHHFAHVASCMAEHGIEGPVLGVAWDGTGYGKDGTIWGGEFLVADSRSFERIACLRPFRLPGGDRAVRDPGRSAFGALYEAAGQEAPLSFAGSERELLIRMIDRNVNSPRTTSAGRLFDAVAYLLGLCSRAAYEGQAAMAVEFALENPSDAEPFDIPLRTDTEPWVLDWGPMLLTIADCARRRTPVARIAAGFHRALTESIVAVARRAHQRCVVLTGGCFQNGCLTEGVVRRLQEEDFKVYWHQRVPPNDGGIAVGQAYIAAQRLKGI